VSQAGQEVPGKQVQRHRVALKLGPQHRALPADPETGREARAVGIAMVDWGQAFEVEHRRLFPHAPAALTTLSNSGMALDHLRALGGAAYLPGRVIARDLAAGSLFVVKDAPQITRHVYGVYLSRNPKLELILQALDVISPGHRIAAELAGGG